MERSRLHSIDLATCDNLHYIIHAEFLQLIFPDCAIFFSGLIEGCWMYWDCHYGSVIGSS
uniref:Uncharacterized protein n=1 Tax=Rhizophora mucronata TaxID=61149 RepID=A0A2P2QLB2_RHIMU